MKTEELRVGDRVIYSGYIVYVTKVHKRFYELEVTGKGLRGWTKPEDITRSYEHVNKYSVIKYTSNNIIGGENYE